MGFIRFICNSFPPLLRRRLSRGLEKNYLRAIYIEKSKISSLIIVMGILTFANIIFSFMLKADKHFLNKEVFCRINLVISIIIFFLLWYFQYRVIKLHKSLLVKRNSVAVGKENDYLKCLINYEGLMYKAFYVLLIVLVICFFKRFYDKYIGISMDILTGSGFIAAIIFLVKLDAEFEKICAEYHTSSYLDYKDEVYKVFNEKWSSMMKDRLLLFYKDWKRLIWLVGIMFVIGVVGLVIPVGYSEWNFLFENMIWFPVEIVLTVFALNKIIERNELTKRKEKANKVIRNKDKTTVKFVRSKITAIIYNNNVYDSKRNDEALFEKLVNDVVKHENKIINLEKLKSMHRVYFFMNGGQKNFNYLGICQIQCKDAFDELNNFMSNYHYFLENDVYIKMDELKDLIYSLGMLSISMNPSFIYNGREIESQDGSLPSNLRKTIVKIKEVFDLLE